MSGTATGDSDVAVDELARSGGQNIRKQRRSLVPIPYTLS